MCRLGRRKIVPRDEFRSWIKTSSKDFNGRSQTPIFVWIFEKKCGIVGVAKEMILWQKEPKEQEH